MPSCRSNCTGTAQVLFRRLVQQLGVLDRGGVRRQAQVDFAIQHAEPGLAERGKCLAEIELVQLRIERAGQPGI